jgi:hypothetical protein
MEQDIRDRYNKTKWVSITTLIAEEMLNVRFNDWEKSC